MTQLAMVGARALPFAETTFDAFKVSDGMTSTYSLGSVSAGTLAEALNSALVEFALFHKDTLILRESDPEGSRLHLFTIKKRSAPSYEWRDHRSVRVDRLYAAPVVALDLDVLAGGAK